jgi:hypothetical protein
MLRAPTLVRDYPAFGQPGDRRSEHHAQPAARWLRHIQHSASDELAGRETGSENHRRAEELNALGLI